MNKKSKDLVKSRKIDIRMTEKFYGDLDRTAQKRDISKAEILENAFYAQRERRIERERRLARELVKMQNKVNMSIHNSTDSSYGKEINELWQCLPKSEK